MKKKNGFTLLELIVVMSVTLTVLSITFAMFSQNTRISSEVNIKSELQEEAGNISSKISNYGMQASGILELTLDGGIEIYNKDLPSEERKYGDIVLVDETGQVNNNDSKKNQWISIKKIMINSKHENITEDGSSEVADSHVSIIYNKYPEDNKDNGKLIINEETFDNANKLAKSVDYTMSENVQNVLIKPSNILTLDVLGNSIINKEGQLSKAASVEIIVNLGKKRGMNDLNYSMDTKVTFRNKGLG